MRLSKGSCSAVGRRAEASLYDRSLATYEKGDLFDHKAAVGFIALWGLPLRVQAQTQWLGRSADDLLRLTAPQPEPAGGAAGNESQGGS